MRDKLLTGFAHPQGTHNCEQYFIDGIERWRRSVGLERVVLLGHSFGGYFAACYATGSANSFTGADEQSIVAEEGRVRDSERLSHLRQ